MESLENEQRDFQSKVALAGEELPEHSNAHRIRFYESKVHSSSKDPNVQGLPLSVHILLSPMFVTRLEDKVSLRFENDEKWKSFVCTFDGVHIRAKKTETAAPAHVLALDRCQEIRPVAGKETWIEFGFPSTLTMSIPSSATRVSWLRALARGKQIKISLNREEYSGFLAAAPYAMSPKFHRLLCEAPRPELPPHMLEKPTQSKEQWQLKKQLVANIVRSEVEEEPMEGPAADGEAGPQQAGRDSFQGEGIHAMEVVRLSCSPSETLQSLFDKLQAKMVLPVGFAHEGKIRPTTSTDWLLKAVGKKEFYFRLQTPLEDSEFVQEHLRSAQSKTMAVSPVLSQRELEEDSKGSIESSPQAAGSASVGASARRFSFSPHHVAFQVADTPAVPIFFVLLHKDYLGFNAFATKPQELLIRESLFRVPTIFTRLDGYAQFSWVQDQDAPTSQSATETGLGGGTAAVKSGSEETKGMEASTNEEEGLPGGKRRSSYFLRLEEEMKKGATPLRRASYSLRASANVGNRLGSGEQQFDVNTLILPEAVGPLPWEMIRKTTTSGPRQLPQPGKAEPDLRIGECDPKDVGLEWGTFLRRDDIAWPFGIRLLGIDGLSKVIESTERGSHGEVIRIAKDIANLISIRVEFTVYFNAAPTPGCRLSSSTYSFVPNLVLADSPWLHVPIPVADIPPHSRLRIMIYGIVPEAVAPTPIGAVVVPMVEPTGFVPVGRHSYRMWPGHFDVLRAPPGSRPPDVSVFGKCQNLTVHVEFTTFAAPVFDTEMLFPQALPAVAQLEHLGNQEQLWGIPGQPLCLPHTSSVDGPREFSPLAWLAGVPGLLQLAAKEGAGTSVRWSRALGVGRDEKSHPLEKTGWMHKLGKSKMTRWRRRWCILRGDVFALYYYASSLVRH